MCCSTPARAERASSAGIAIGLALGLGLVLAPALARAHDGETHAWTGWTFDPLAASAILASSALYATGVTRLWRRTGRGHGIRAWEVACFLAAQATLVIALLSPLDAWSDALFSAHMGQHELLMLVAAPLLILSRPWIAAPWILPARARLSAGAFVNRRDVRAGWHALSHPLVAVAVQAVVLWVWHVPRLFEAALADERVHALQHAMFFAVAALFWWTLLHGRWGRAGYGAGVAWVFATAGHSGLLGALLTLAREVWYPTYATRAPVAGVGALEDQQVAGLLMWVPAGVLLTISGLALLAAWLGEAERRVQRTRVHAVLRGEEVP